MTLTRVIIESDNMVTACNKCGQDQTGKQAWVVPLDLIVLCDDCTEALKNKSDSRERQNGGL